MRVSCNGCRVLRKGCTENCSIKPCLQWIISPESQSNATLFLAKFYGRAGLQNLINAGPDHLRPAIFRSLLYEACGRIVNPIYGSAGLLCSGNWQLCHAAVEAVLNGLPITQVSPDSDAGTISPPLKACDIRHVSKDVGDESAVLHKVKTSSRGRFKRSGSKQKRSSAAAAAVEVEPAVDQAAQVMWSWSHQNPKSDRDRDRDRSGSHESVMTHPAEPPSRPGEGDVVSMETVEASPSISDGSAVELELTLGSKPNPKTKESSRATQQEEEDEDEEENQSDGDRCRIELRLSCSPPVVLVNT